MRADVVRRRRGRSAPRRRRPVEVSWGSYGSSATRDDLTVLSGRSLRAAVAAVCGVEPAARVRYRHAFEVRHPSYFTAEFAEQLREHDIGFVVADTAGKFPYAETVASDFVYVRLHGSRELYVIRNLENFARLENKPLRRRPEVAHRPARRQREHRLSAREERGHSGADDATLRHDPAGAFAACFRVHGVAYSEVAERGEVAIAVRRDHGVARVARHR